MKRLVRLTAVLMVVVVFAGACGDDDSGVTTTGDDGQEQDREEQGDDSRENPVPPGERSDDIADGDTRSEDAEQESPAGTAEGELEEPGAGPTTTSSPSPPRTEPQPPPAPSSGSGVSGVVTFGPQCPVIVEGESCPDEPAGGAEVRIRRATGSTGSREATGGEVVESTTADGDGRFQLALAPGDYVAEAQASGAQSCDPAAFTVHDGRYSEVRIRCDSGMR